MGLCKRHCGVVAFYTGSLTVISVHVWRFVKEIKSALLPYFPRKSETNWILISAMVIVNGKIPFKRSIYIRCKIFHLHTTIFFSQNLFLITGKTPYPLLMWYVIYAWGSSSRQVIFHKIMKIVLFDTKVKRWREGRNWGKVRRKVQIYGLQITNYKFCIQN